MPSFDASNPFYQWAESTPEGRRANYFSYQDQFGKAPNQRKWFEDQFQRVQDTYMGKGLAYLKAGGQDPQSADDFFKNYFAQGGGAQQEWGAMAPSQRGVQDSRFAPSVRWNV